MPSPEQGEIFALAHPMPPEPQPTDRDLPAEVFAHLAERVVVTKRDLGIKPATGPRVMSPAQRRAIAARIEEHGGGDEGIEACKRVIAVDEFECRRGGRDCAGWAYWNADTPFRPGNFEQRLGRFREDGNHIPFGGSSTRKPTGAGFHAHMEPHELDDLIEQCMLDPKDRRGAVSRRQGA